MNAYRCGLSLIVLFVLLLATACGANAPTLTPVPPTATENPLPLTYTSVNGALSVNYPRGWVVDEQGAYIGIANNDPAMRAMAAQRSLEAGQVGLLMTAFSADTAAAIAAQNGLSVDAPTAADLVGIVASRLTTVTPSAVTEINVNGKNAAYVTLLLPSGDSIAIVVEVGNGSLVLLQAATAPNELAQFQETFLAIAGTVNFTPPSSAVAEETGAAPIPP